MVAATHAPDSYPSLSLPVARFTGEVADLNAQYAGASRLANFVVARAVQDRPEHRVQIATWLRRGRLLLETVYIAPGLGSLFVELRVGDHGQRAQLTMLHKDEAAKQGSWSVAWARPDAASQYRVAEATRQALVAPNCYDIEHHAYPAVPELDHAPTEQELKQPEGLALRAAAAFEDHHLNLVIAAGQLELSRFHIDRA